MMSLLLVYSIAAFLLAIYTLGHGVLLWQALRPVEKKQKPQSLKTFPEVTVQLPIYNEQHVALRLLEAVSKLDYPAEKLQIQLLDDSSDHSSYLLAQAILQYPHLQIQHIRRPNREGYKAGALAYGLSLSSSPYIAIFDADFIPPSDFLQMTIPYLEVDTKLAFVQTRWGHLNPDENWLSRAQVLAIDNHFLLEQMGRNQGKYFIPFNGTGGVWRVAAIEAAGGWSDDSLTEDLDLSFRAQLAAWKALYLPEIIVAGELPPQLAAYRQQQKRWAKGSSQAFRKLIGKLWLSDKPLMLKVMATQHLAQYVPQFLMLVMFLLSPILLLGGQLKSLPLAPLGLIGLIPPLMLAIAQAKQGGNWLGRFAVFPALLLIGTGLIAQNSIAVLSGFFFKKGEFQRTPKFAADWQASQYALRSNSFLEAILMFYAAWGVFLAWQVDKAFLIYFLIHALSFGLVAFWEWRDAWQLKQVPRLIPKSLND